MRAFRRAPFTCLGLLAAAAITAPASAANPVLRHQEDLHGNVRVFGSTLAFDCGAGVSAPPGATASCANQLNITDTAPDLYWRDNTSNAMVTPLQARTSATLSLPPGSTVTYARLYWAALKDGDQPDKNVILDWLGGPQQTITADSTWVIPYGFATHPTWNYYQASGDATDFVSTWGAGDFRVSDVEALPLAGIEVDRAFSAWTLVVFYENPGEDLRNLALFDGFNAIDPSQGTPSAQVDLKGFLIPQGFNAQMTAIAYEGDKSYTGDHFTVNGAKLTDAKNPVDDFFNSSRSALGKAVSGQWDVPKLSGESGTMASYDLDTVDVTSYLKAGDTQCTVGADSAQDVFFLGGFVTSVQSLIPDFKGVLKEVEDLNGGAVVPGDTLQYTITAVNAGNDTAVNATMTDTIEAGLSFVPGSIEILEGGNTGLKTDKAGDDEGDYDGPSKTLTVRVGFGADETFGGEILPGETVKIRFKVKVTAQMGTVANQAILTVEGEAGGPEKQYPSDGDPLSVGSQPTVVTVYECDSNDDCMDPAKPHCDLQTHVCTGCVSDDDCPDPSKPACQPNGTCNECSSSNDKLCVGDEPVCDTMQGLCVLCTLGPMGDASKCAMDPDGPKCVAGMNNTVHCGCLEDTDCDAPNGTPGKVCDSVPQTCVPGCRGVGGNGCPDGLVCTSKDSTIGQCVPEMGTGGGGGGGVGGGSGDGGNGAGNGDGGSGNDGLDPGEDSGCACSVPASSGSSTGAFAAALAFVGLAARRRRRA